MQVNAGWFGLDCSQANTRLDSCACQDPCACQPGAWQMINFPTKWAMSLLPRRSADTGGSLSIGRELGYNPSQMTLADV
jgi:hypothetical protein